MLMDTLHYFYYYYNHTQHQCREQITGITEDIDNQSTNRYSTASITAALYEITLKTSTIGKSG